MIEKTFNMHVEKKEPLVILILGGNKKAVKNAIAGIEKEGNIALMMDVSEALVYNFTSDQVNSDECTLVPKINFELYKRNSFTRPQRRANQKKIKKMNLMFKLK